MRLSRFLSAVPLVLLAAAAPVTNVSAVTPTAPPMCTLGTGPAGDAKPMAGGAVPLSAQGPGGNADSLDLLDYSLGIDSKHKTLYVTLHVSSLSSGPNG